MIIGVRREEGCEEKAVRVIDSSTGRGLILHYNNGEWNSVLMADIEGDKGPQSIGNYFVSEKYLPRDLPDEEFNGLYDKVKTWGFPLFREMKQFDPQETPSLNSLVEESEADFMAEATKRLRKAS